MPGITLQGFLLFLFVPLVLFLFLRQPLGPGWSVALGVAIMLGHRVVAAPWAAKFADVRCLWCGRIGVSTSLPVESQGRVWSMHACSPAHAAGATRFFDFTHRWRALVAAGILMPLAWLLLASASAALGWPLTSHETDALVFRVVVATTVVSAAVLPFVGRSGRRRDPAEPLRSPFPIHNLFLLGIRNTLWIFRVVGGWWIADGLRRLF